MSDIENPGYILRINTDEWEQQVFDLKKYYTGVIRNYRKGTPILFLKKVKVDSFIGYGVVDRVEHLWEMTPEEEDYCRENGWKIGLTFQPLIRCDTPFPLKESALSGDPRKGGFLQGAMLTENQVSAILEGAEEYERLVKGAEPEPVAPSA